MDRDKPADQTAWPILMARDLPSETLREAGNLNENEPSDAERVSAVFDDTRDGFEEKRAAKRMAIEADIGFQSGTNSLIGFTEDISTGGLFIAAYDVRERRSVLTVNFSLANGHLISANGTVRWVREYNDAAPEMMPGMGIQFESLTQSDREAIHRFTEQRAPHFCDE